MIDFERIKKIDLEEMFKVYDNWPQIAKESYQNNNLKQVNFKKSEHIVFAGMGGSGAIGDIFSSILSKTNIHVDVVKGYLLPKTVDSKSIVVITSVSGNTEETISALKLAISLRCNVIAFSGGGEIKKICENENIEYREIPMTHSPRASFTKFLFSMLQVLQPIIPISKEDIDESIKQLEYSKEKIFSQNLNDKNPALVLANWITDMPIIYYPWGLQAAAIRFKNSLQENAKIHATTEDIIETCHNGIVAWEKDSSKKPIFIQGENDYIKTKERWKILKEFFDEKEIQYKEIHSIDGNILSKLINLIYVLDYATIYKAIINGINPTTVHSIKLLKNKIKNFN